MKLGRLGSAWASHQHLHACSTAQHARLRPFEETANDGYVGLGTPMQQVCAHARVLCMHSMGSMGGARLHGKRNSMQLGPSDHACNSDVAASRLPSL